jgi:hypothetical protein
VSRSADRWCRTKLKTDSEKDMRFMRKWPTLAVLTADTLICSCYPHDLLGDPPWWYRGDRYKKSIVRDPRATLADQFNLRLPDGVEVRVHDSTRDVRWMVLPRRPDGTEAWSEEQLAALVTIDSMVGTAPALDPTVLAQSERRERN